MTIDELPNCLKIIYHYLEQIVTIHNRYIYLMLRKYMLNTILRASDNFRKDVCPYIDKFKSPGWFQIHTVVYEKEKVIMIVIFLNLYEEEFHTTRPEEVTTYQLKSLLLLLDNLFEIE